MLRLQAEKERERAKERERERLLVIRAILPEWCSSFPLEPINCNITFQNFSMSKSTRTQTLLWIPGKKMTVICICVCVLWMLKSCADNRDAPVFPEPVPSRRLGGEKKKKGGEHMSEKRGAGEPWVWYLSQTSLALLTSTFHVCYVQLPHTRPQRACVWGESVIWKLPQREEEREHWLQARVSHPAWEISITN